MAGEQGGTPASKRRVRVAEDVEKALQEHAPWRPIAQPAIEDIGAIQACVRGDALPHQQQRAIAFICEISRNGGAHFFPGENGRRDTDFALGRAFVGEQIVTISRIRLNRGGEHA